MKQSLYLLSRRDNDVTYRFEVISRVICALVEHHGKYVRYRHSWHRLHEVTEFDALMNEIMMKGGTAYFFSGLYDVPHGQRLPFIDPSVDRSVGLYPEALG